MQAGCCRCCRPETRLNTARLQWCWVVFGSSRTTRGVCPVRAFLEAGLLGSWWSSSSSTSMLHFFSLSANSTNKRCEVGVLLLVRAFLVAKPFRDGLLLQSKFSKLQDKIEIFLSLSLSLSLSLFPEPQIIQKK